MEKNSIQCFLVIQTASIGDVVLVTPVLEALHDKYPSARIDLLIRKGFESLFYGHPFLNNVLIWDKKKDKYKNLYRIITEVRSSHYDLVVNVQRFFTSGLVTVLSGAKETVGFDKNPLSWFFSRRVPHYISQSVKGQHEADRNLSLLGPVFSNAERQLKLYPTKEDLAHTSALKPSPYICIAPASLWFTKQLPEALWVEFVKKVPQHIHVYLLGSAADKNLCRRIIEDAGHPNAMELAGRLSLLESAALMRDALMNYVNDSAPLHLCSAVNAKTTAIFCSTVPNFGFGPLSDDAAVVETSEPLSCRPCGLHGHKSCPQKHFICGNSINTNLMINRL